MAFWRLNTAQRSLTGQLWNVAKRFCSFIRSLDVTSLEAFGLVLVMGIFPELLGFTTKAQSGLKCRCLIIICVDSDIINHSSLFSFDLPSPDHRRTNHWFSIYTNGTVSLYHFPLRKNRLWLLGLLQLEHLMASWRMFASELLLRSYSLSVFVHTNKSESFLFSLFSQEKVQSQYFDANSKHNQMEHKLIYCMNHDDHEFGRTS